MESDGLYFIVKGSFMVYYKEPSNIVQILGPGDYFGDMCLIDKRSHVTYQATSDCVCLFVETQEVKNILQSEYFDQLFLKRLCKFRAKFIHGLTRSFAHKQTINIKDTEEEEGMQGMGLALADLMRPMFGVPPTGAEAGSQPKLIKDPKEESKGAGIPGMQSLLEVIPKNLMRHAKRYHSRLDGDELLRETTPLLEGRADQRGAGIAGLFSGLFGPGAPPAQRSQIDLGGDPFTKEENSQARERRAEASGKTPKRVHLGSAEHSFQSSHSQARLNPSTPVKGDRRPEDLHTEVHFDKSVRVSAAALPKPAAVGGDTTPQRNALRGADGRSNRHLAKADSPYKQELKAGKGSVPYIPESEVDLNKNDLRNLKSTQKHPMEGLRKALMTTRDQARHKSKVVPGLGHADSRLSLSQNHEKLSYNQLVAIRSKGLHHSKGIL